ncbi:MAG TPA: acyltransferase [Saprospiraceae bacterium]|nr:acyltransferase [Saprospiraceae bacterium]
MRFLRRVIFKIYRELLLFRIVVGKRFWGIDYVVRQLALCPRVIISDLLRRNGAIIGENVNFKDSIQIDNAAGDRDSTGSFSNLVIGDCCYIGKGVFFDLPAKVQIERECVISAGVKLLTHQDCGDRLMQKYYPRQVKGIVIGEGTWIGANALILSGVRLGRCCVVGAGAVVTQSFPDYSVVVGVPARVVNSLK